MLGVVGSNLERVKFFMQNLWMLHDVATHSRPQRPRSFWSAPRIATSGLVQHRKSAIHGRDSVTLRMLRVKSDKSDWFCSQSIVFTKSFKTGLSLDLARGRDSWCCAAPGDENACNNVAPGHAH